MEAYHPAPKYSVEIPQSLGWQISDPRRRDLRVPYHPISHAPDTFISKYRRVRFFGLML